MSLALRAANGVSFGEMMPIPSIPVFDEATIRADAAKHWRGDTEKVATTPLKSLNHRNVNISSRYDKADEYRVMATAIEHIPQAYVDRIESVFCDSKACAVYSIIVNSRDLMVLRIVAELFQYGCVAFDGGHNGIVVKGQDGGEIVLGSSWSDVF